MNKRVSVPVLLGLLACSLPLFAQESETMTPEQLRATGTFDVGTALALDRPDLFSTVDGALLIHSLPALTLLDGRRILVSGELGRMGLLPLDLFPVAFLSSAIVQPTSASTRYGSDATGGVVDLRLNRNYSGGEVGIFYGKSGGKHGREDFQSYITGGVGNDKFQISAGASYSESNFSGPRRGR